MHGLPGVYVADSSLFPDSVEVNPYLTIMALADRTAEAVAADIGLALPLREARGAYQEEEQHLRLSSGARP